VDEVHPPRSCTPARDCSAVCAHVLIFINPLSYRILESVFPICLHACNLEGLVPQPTLKPEDFAFFSVSVTLVAFWWGGQPQKATTYRDTLILRTTATLMLQIFHSTQMGTSFRTRNERFTYS